MYPRNHKYHSLAGHWLSGNIFRLFILYKSDYHQSISCEGSIKYHVKIRNFLEDSINDWYRVARKKVYQFSDFFKKNKGYFLLKLWVANERLLYFWWIAVRKSQKMCNHSPSDYALQFFGKLHATVGCVKFSKSSKIIKHNPGNYQVLLRDFRTTFIFLIRQM